MVATELMVGDWVYAIDANGEKHPCWANNLEYDYTNKRGDFCVDFYGTGYEAEWPDVTFNVEPIPLTPEILEKNGFKHYHPENKKAEYWQLFTNGGDINVKKTYGFYRFRIYGKPIKPDAALPSFSGHLYNVHQLQHAIRLCGIEKEIVL